MITAKNIYGTVPDSISIFLMSLTENVYINAFVKDKFEIINPKMSIHSLFNKKIISCESIEQNAIIICSDKSENIDLIEKLAIDNNCRLCKIGVHKIADEILNSKVVIYGTGNRGKDSLKLLRENGVNVIGFTESDKSKIGSKIEDLEVVDFDEIDNNTVVVIASGYYKEIFNKICDEKIRIYCDYTSIFCIKYYPYILIRSDLCKYDVLWQFNAQLSNLMMQVFYKKIIIDGYKDFGKDLIRVLSLMDKSIEYCIDDEEYEVKEDNISVKSKYDLIYEDMYDKMVIVCKTQYVNDEAVYPEADFLESLGLNMNEHYRLVSTMFSEGYKLKSKKVRNRCIALDPVSAFAIYHPNTSERYNQYIVHGNPDTAKIRIMTLGGSTTDGGYFYPIKSWPEHLYDGNVRYYGVIWIQII